MAASPKSNSAQWSATKTYSGPRSGLGYRNFTASFFAFVIALAQDRREAVAQTTRRNEERERE
jgi:hypothetical protein